MLTSFGPGAMVDLPTHAIVIGGLENWQGVSERIYEPRLEAWLTERFGGAEVKLMAPPIDTNGGDDPKGRTGVAAFVFPHWFVGQIDETWTAPDGRVYRTRPLIPWDQLVKGSYFDRDRKLRPVVPVRFVQACVRGHLSDVDWYAFARAPRTTKLWLDEGGASNDLNEIFVRDETTGRRRPMSDAKIPGTRCLGDCKGRQPWLGPRVAEACGEENRLLTRSASQAYYAHTMSAIAIPDATEALRKAVDGVWDDHLAYAESAADIRKERRREKVHAALDGFDDAAVWAEVERRRAPVEANPKGIKEAELETFLSQRETGGDDVPDGDFFARRLPATMLADLPAPLAGRLDRVVLIHRLREVTAQVGFTRFEASLVRADGELDLGVELAPLARDLKWLPACQNRGEGVFLSFAPDAIAAWLARPAVQARGRELVRGFETWKARRGLEAAEFVGLPYLMLHSLAHLLIVTLSLDCGYSASAIRERIYAVDGVGYGILLRTGSPGSEGTLGGLVEVGREIGKHLSRALELGRLCSNDPICAQHAPESPHEERFLHGAACHGCLLIGETSCEQRNELLDRALVVPTVGTLGAGAAFFAEEG